MASTDDKRKKARDEGDKRNMKTVTLRNQKRAARKSNLRNQAHSVEGIVARYADLQKINTATITLFTDLPLSECTLMGLKDCDYTSPTEIQRDSLPFSLTGADVVGAAKTGSGKTLALVIPLLECLWRAGWQSSHGLGALIISPTRELALQTFTCINQIGKHHDLSCALLIGGTDMEYERNRIGHVNIIVCTPGRLLQHMDENFNLNCDDMQLLVIDEADRILDLGFSKQINAIVANLPSTRQTLLFSATQTKNVKDLCRVCTKDPVFISVHERASHATPDQLKQSYMVCEEHEKLNTIWSFVNNYKKNKVLVFVSSCKQARFFTRAFCHLRPGTVVMGLWGSMNQTKRIDEFQKFENNSKGAVMFATDVASRGLDFSDVDWVIQMDAPATVDDYIHRVGRTARMERKGQAVLLLTQRQEEGMVSALEQRNIPLEKLSVNTQQLRDIQARLQSFVAQFPEMNTFAQKSIVAYLRCVYLMRDKNIFDVESVDAAALASSYGLLTVPRVRFLSKKGISTKDKQEATDIASRLKTEMKPEPARSEHHEDSGKKCDLMGAFTAPEIGAGDEDLFTVKTADIFQVLNENYEMPEDVGGEDKKEKKAKVITKAKAIKKILNKGVIVNRKTTFDADGDVVERDGPSAVSTAAIGLDIQEAVTNMKAIDKADRDRARLIRKEAKLADKRKLDALKRNGRGDADVDSDGGGGSGVNSDVDLSWIPDPDEIKQRYGIVNDDEEDFVPSDDDKAEPAPKRHRADDARKLEEAALAMLNPF